MLRYLFLFVFLFARHASANDLVSITNFSSNTEPEWVEITNQSSDTIDMTGWQIKDGNSSDTDDISLAGCLSPNSTAVFLHEAGWLNNGGDTISLYDSTNQLLDQLVYTVGRTGPPPVASNSCTPSPTPTMPSLTPSPTVTLSPSSTLTPTKTSTPTRTPTPIHTSSPTSTLTPTLTPTRSPTVTLTPSPTPTSEPTPTDSPPTPTDTPIQPTPTKTSTPTGKSSLPNQLLPTVLIVVGGLMLVVPVVFSQIKK